MTAVTESDIRELKELIQAQKVYLDERFGKLENKIESLETEFKKEIEQVKLSQAHIEGQLEGWKPSIGKLPDLIEKVGELKNWKQAGLNLRYTSTSKHEPEFR